MGPRWSHVVCNIQIGRSYAACSPNTRVMAVGIVPLEVKQLNAMEPIRQFLHLSVPFWFRCSHTVQPVTKLCQNDDIALSVL